MNIWSSIFRCVVQSYCCMNKLTKNGVNLRTKMTSKRMSTGLLEIINVYFGFSHISKYNEQIQLRRKGHKYRSLPQSNFPDPSGLTTGITPTSWGPSVGPAFPFSILIEHSSNCGTWWCPFSVMVLTLTRIVFVKSRWSTQMCFANVEKPKFKPRYSFYHVN